MRLRSLDIFRLVKSPMRMLFKRNSHKFSTRMPGICSYLLMCICQVKWFNCLALLQWRLSNPEVSSLNIASFGFVDFTRIGRVNPMCEVRCLWSIDTILGVGCLWSIDTKQANFRSHACIDVEFFSALHDYMTISQPALISWHHILCCTMVWYGLIMYFCDSNHEITRSSKRKYNNIKDHQLII